MNLLRCPTESNTYILLYGVRRNVRLTVYTDYGLRLLMYVALKKGELATIQEVADAYGISKNHLMKVTYDLGRTAFWRPCVGAEAGFGWPAHPEQIGLGDVVRRMEEDFAMVECFAPSSNRCAITGSCRLKGILKDALGAYLAVLDHYTLADLTGRNPALARTLFAG